MAKPCHPLANIYAISLAVIILVMNLITFCCYCSGARAANLVQNKMSYLNYAVLAAHTVFWFITIGIFKMTTPGQTGVGAVVTVQIPYRRRCSRSLTSTICA